MSTPFAGGGGGGAVASVVGQTGAVTGAQIVADPTVQSAIGGRTVRVTDAISAPQTGTGTSSFQSWTFRIRRTLPVVTTRWRVRIADISVLGNLPNSAQTTTLSGIWFGSASNTSAANPYTFAAAPTKVINGTVLPTDGTDFTSAWVTDPAQQFAPGVTKVLSFGADFASTSAGFTSDSGRAMGFSTSSANAGDTTFSGSTPGGAPFDFRIEYETVTDRKIGVVFGTSLCQGFTANNTGIQADQAWPAQLQNIHGSILLINASCGSSTMATYGTAVQGWKRIDLTTTVPDFAVLEISNDTLANVTLASIQTSVNSMINQCRTAGIPKVYIVMPAPRPATTSTVVGTLQAATTVGATSISVDFNPGAVALAFDQGNNFETATASAVSGTGPWTVTVPALTKAHAAGTYVRSGAERARQEVINWLRNPPAYLSGVLDWDVVLCDKAGGWDLDSRYKGGDGIHFQPAAHAILARLLVS